VDVVSALADEYARLDGILATLTDAQWASPSLAAGWSILDVVVHLASTEEMVALTLSSSDEVAWNDTGGDLDATMDVAVRTERDAPGPILRRWRAATDASLTALAAADPDRKVRWAAAPLRPRTLATTRLAEHWAHGLDITGPLDIAFEDTDRLRHVAWLGHATIPYGCALAGVEAQPVRVELVGPSGDPWEFGPEDAASTIEGDAGAFCRVGAQRLAPAESGLRTSGPFGATALGVLRNYAA
jgi:uncharacterized protein (TIGR03084 family)